jgi:hypothetical protein
MAWLQRPNRSSTKLDEEGVPLAFLFLSADTRTAIGLLRACRRRRKPWRCTSRTAGRRRSPRKVAANRGLPPLGRITPRRRTTTSCGRSFAAPAASLAWRSRRRRRSSSTRAARWSWPFRTICAGLRDRALLLVGWAAALRRNELVALEVADLGLEPEGVVLTIRRSKI